MQMDQSRLFLLIFETIFLGYFNAICINNDWMKHLANLSDVPDKVER